MGDRVDTEVGAGAGVRAAAEAPPRPSATCSHRHHHQQHQQHQHHHHHHHHQQHQQHQHQNQQQVEPAPEPAASSPPPRNHQHRHQQHQQHVACRISTPRPCVQQYNRWQENEARGPKRGEEASVHGVKRSTHRHTDARLTVVNSRNFVGRHAIALPAINPPPHSVRANNNESANLGASRLYTTRA